MEKIQESTSAMKKKAGYARGFTRVPNIFFDDWLPALSGNEIKVLMAIWRKTIGWRKDIDNISSRQLTRLCGLSRSSTTHAVKSLVSKGLIEKFRNGSNANWSASSYKTLLWVQGGSNFAQAELKIRPEDAQPLDQGGRPKFGPTKETLIHEDTEETLKEGHKECFGAVIKLLPGQYQALCSKYTQAIIDNTIESMNDWAAAQGKRYKDYAAAIRNWIRKDQRNRENRKSNLNSQDPIARHKDFSSVNGNSFSNSSRIHNFSEEKR